MTDKEMDALLLSADGFYERYFWPAFKLLCTDLNDKDDAEALTFLKTQDNN